MKTVCGGDGFDELAKEIREAGETVISQLCAYIYEISRSRGAKRDENDNQQEG
jgi:hypothetical protein